jgi:hypothetical protein
MTLASWLAYDARMSSRRTLLRIGGGAVLAGAAVLAWRAWDQGVFSVGEGPAFEAWNTWNPGASGAEPHLVHAAILAASPHNTQPWRFRISKGRVDLFADPARNVGTIDPFRREMHVGLGCALENLLQAAAGTGLVPRLAMFPNAGDPTHVASVTLEPGARVASPLYAAIPHRHTNRGASDTRRALPASVFTAEQA